MLNLYMIRNWFSKFAEFQSIAHYLLKVFVGIPMFANGQLDGTKYWYSYHQN